MIDKLKFSDSTIRWLAAGGVGTLMLDVAITVGLLLGSGNSD
jgi:hypothetical protein